jgi:hypothetical protein
MEDISDWPTDMMISVQPDGDSWKVVVMQEGSILLKKAAVATQRYQ